MQLLDITIVVGGSLSGSSWVGGTSYTYSITEDTLILYVDSDEEVGAEGGSIRLANAYNGSKVDISNNNVKYYFDGNSDKELSVIVVDVNNNMKW